MVVHVDTQNTLQKPCGLWPAKKVMAALGYRNRDAFWSFVKKSGLPRIRLNARRIVFDPRAVDAWLQRRAIGQHPSSIIQKEGNGNE